MASADETLAQFAALPPSQLRERFAEVFAAAASAGDSPLARQLTARAFEGPDGVAFLRSEAVQPFVLQGLGHADATVRAETIALLKPLASAAADVARLAACGALALIAAALGGELSPSQRAADFFGACAGGGAAALRAALDDAPTLAALRALGGGEKGSTVQLRALATFAEAAAAGEAQLKLLDGLGLLAPLAPLCRDEDDPLSALNALELVAIVARGAGGLSWLDGKGIPAELAASLDVDVDADPMAALRRPATLQCLANILDRGGLGADALLTSERLVDRAWPLLAAPPEVRGAALALLHGAAASVGGARAVLLGDADDAVADAVPLARLEPLRVLLRSTDTRVRVSALGVAARLCETAADDAAVAAGLVCLGGGGGKLGCGNAAQVSGASAAAAKALQHLVGGAAARADTTAGDALADLVASADADVRRAALRLLKALAALRWGAAGLAASEGVLELLLAAPRHPLDADELRERHAVAELMAAAPHVVAMLGEATAAQLGSAVAAGPFARQQPAAASAAGPLTL